MKSYEDKDPPVSRDVLRQSSGQTFNWLVEQLCVITVIWQRTMSRSWYLSP